MTPAKQRILVAVLILLGILLACFFGLRALFAFREFRRHGPPPLPPLAPMEAAPAAETDVELIRDWMTIPYIAMTYQVHPKVIFDALDISPRGNDEKSLAQLNEEFFPDSPGLVIELVKATVQAHQPAPTVDSPTPPATPSAP
jgi:hypothetical protein